MFLYHVLVRWCAVLWPQTRGLQPSEVDSLTVLKDRAHTQGVTGPHPLSQAPGEGPSSLLLAAGVASHPWLVAASL